MAGNKNLHNANKQKNDEFYTQWIDIEREMQAYLEYNPEIFRGKTILCPCDDPEWSNFTKFFALHFVEYGIKKLISTSYAVESKAYKEGYQISLFEKMNSKFDIDKTRTCGKIFILDNEDVNKDGKIDIEDLKWEYLQGDGDYNSAEVNKLRAESDIIITNPPFSQFRNFLAWLLEDNKKFLILGDQNAITYKEVFPLIAKNLLWLGYDNGGIKWFRVPIDYDIRTESRKKIIDGVKYFSMGRVCWFTNLEHGRRHQPLPLMTMSDNLRFSKHKEIKGKESYDKYDNYDAIEVPYVDAIPSDYDGVMGVPITFLDKYCPEQFEIVAFRKGNDGKDLVYSFADSSERERERERERESTTVFQNPHSTMFSDPSLTERIFTEELQFATAIQGMIKNAEGKIGNKITYARITIRHKGVR